MPELIADCRRRYEDTPETAVSIARGYGVDDRTVRCMAKRFNWTKYRAPPVGATRGGRCGFCRPAIGATG